MVTSRTRVAAVLGHPVAHSLSPVLHRAAYAELGLTGWHYEIHDVDEPELVGFLAGLDERWAGLSLTMPLKQVALRAVDVVQPLAEAVGAVNTILLQAGRLLVGANTDVHGMVQALREAEPVPAGASLSRGVIIGGGATAASALAALGELGVRRPVVLVRSLGRAGTVLRAAAAMGLEPELVTLGSDRATGLLRDAQVVVSTVPDRASDALAPLIADASLDPSQVLLDVVYEGWPTPLPTQWLASGGSVSPGYLMLLHQACEQVRLMTGHPAPEAAMRAALLAEVAPRVNGWVLVITGALVAVAAALLAPRARALADRPSRWTSTPVLAVLGAAGGAGAAAAADGVVELVTFAAFALGCALIVGLDLACHRIPDVVTVPTAVVLVAGLALAAAQTGDWSAFGRALLAGLVLGGAFLVLALISPSSLGLGDVKLAALLGVFLGWFGWQAVGVAVVATFLLGGFVAVGLVLSRRATRSTALAFGPWLVLGAAVAVAITG